MGALDDFLGWAGDKVDDVTDDLRYGILGTSKEDLYKEDHGTAMGLKRDWEDSVITAKNRARSLNRTTGDFTESEPLRVDYRDALDRAERHLPEEDKPDWYNQGARRDPESGLTRYDNEGLRGVYDKALEYRKVVDNFDKDYSDAQTMALDPKNVHQERGVFQASMDKMGDLYNQNKYYAKSDSEFANKADEDTKSRILNDINKKRQDKKANRIENASRANLTSAIEGGIISGESAPGQLYSDINTLVGKSTGKDKKIYQSYLSEVEQDYTDAIGTIDEEDKNRWKDYDDVVWDNELLDNPPTRQELEKSGWKFNEGVTDNQIKTMIAGIKGLK